MELFVRMYNELIRDINDESISDEKIETHILLMRLIRIKRIDVERYYSKLLYMIKNVNTIEMVLKTRLMSRV